MLAWLLNLGFAAGGAPAVVVTETTGGGRKRQQRRYPRRVMIDGVMHVVQRPEEERALLQAMLDRAREASVSAPAPAKVAARKRVVRLARRVEEARAAERTWDDYLRELDDELIILLA